MTTMAAKFLTLIARVVTAVVATAASAPMVTVKGAKDSAITG